MTAVTDEVADVPTAEVVVLNSVTKVHPGGVTALDDVSVTVRRGELAAIVGPSGSGKSTMLKVIGTLDRPTSGQVRVDGHKVADLTDRQLSAMRARSIGFVFQHFHLAPGVSALDNVSSGLLYSGVGLRMRRERAAAALRRVGLGRRLERWPHELSGGESQRVAIARAVIGDPALLLADEPTGALDSRSGRVVMELLRELHAAGTTVLVITHDREIAASLPRQVAMLDGRVHSDREVGARSRSRDVTRGGGMLTPARMQPSDVVRTGGFGLRSRPVRVLLSALGIAVGIAAMASVVDISSSSRA
nr:ABC transporter ATP-binding protein [Streptomyces polyasparticus]